MKAALAVARSYHDGHGARAVRRVARGAWSSTALVPIPAPRTQSVSMRLGLPFSAQLVARVKARHGVVWANALGLPPGLTLSPTGLLSGTPTQAGVFTLLFQVSGTAPTTVPMTGSVSVVVTTAAVSTAVTAGGQTSCATHNDGTLWCWGRNNFGQLGDGTTTPRPTPAPVGTFVDWKQVSASGSTACGVRADSTLWCWGLNNFGQLGVAGPSRSTPVQVGTNATWTSVSTSWFHTCATRSNGTLWCWGANRHGELGLGGINRGYVLPHKVGSVATWASVTSGGFHTCATRTDGTAWCWGQNIFGQLGNAKPAIQPNPVQVGLLTDWKQLSASWAHTCGLTMVGQLRCWGSNSSGQVGDGTLTTQLAPVPVASDRTWTSISTAESSTCAIDAAGGAWCWGANHYGQLGNGQTTTSLVPSPVPSDRPWESLTAGWWHGCGVRQGGEAVCWGNNEWGQLGDATLVTTRHCRRRCCEPRSSRARADFPLGAHDDAGHGRWRGRDRPRRPVRQPHRQRRTGFRTGPGTFRSELDPVGDADAPAQRARPAAPRGGGRPRHRQPPAGGCQGPRQGRREGRRGAAVHLQVTSFNVLGSQHTAPGGAAPEFAPGRVRTDWAANLVACVPAERRRASGAPGRPVRRDRARAAGRYAFYPGAELGGRGIPRIADVERDVWTPDVASPRSPSRSWTPSAAACRIVRLRAPAPPGREI